MGDWADPEEVEPETWVEVTGRNFQEPWNEWGGAPIGHTDWTATEVDGAEPPWGLS